MTIQSAELFNGWADAAEVASSDDPEGYSPDGLRSLIGVPSLETVTSDSFFR